MKSFTTFLVALLLVAITGCVTHEQHSNTSRSTSYGNASILGQSGYAKVNLKHDSSNSSAYDLIALLEGTWIVAQDGQPLGKITTNEFDSKSILNEFGKYGSEFSSTSIFNEFGKYGSEFSNLSPYNEFGSEPPLIVDSNGTFLAYLTVNDFKTPAINPHILIALLKQ